VGKTAQKVKKVVRQQAEPADMEKLQILLSEVQKLKNQIFFLQQTLIQLRSQVSPNFYSSRAVFIQGTEGYSGNMAQPSNMFKDGRAWL
jgi:hypothetical protein